MVRAALCPRSTWRRPFCDCRDRAVSLTAKAELSGTCDGSHLRAPVPLLPEHSVTSEKRGAAWIVSSDTTFQTAEESTIRVLAACRAASCGKRVPLENR